MPGCLDLEKKARRYLNFSNITLAPLSREHYLLTYRIFDYDSILPDTTSRSFNPTLPLHFYRPNSS
jgi:hypothetical protein